MILAAAAVAHLGIDGCIGMQLLAVTLSASNPLWNTFEWSLCIESCSKWIKINVYKTQVVPSKIIV